jgi:hypothetical protein
LVDVETTDPLHHGAFGYTSIPFTCSEILHQASLEEILLSIEGENAGEVTTLYNMGAYPKSLEIFEGHFSEKRHLQTLVTIEMQLGGSAGSYDRFYALFDCPHQAELITTTFSGQPQGKPIDLNGDGLLELVTSGGHTWMCELGDLLEVITWESGKAKIIYEVHSYHDMDCGDTWAVQSREPGDTLGMEVRSLFSDDDQNGLFEILQIRETTVSGGGSTREEIGQMAEVMIDSVHLTWQGDGWR